MVLFLLESKLDPLCTLQAQVINFVKTFILLFFSKNSFLGPVGLACAASCFALGAAAVAIGDLNEARLRQAASFGCLPILLGPSQPSLEQQLKKHFGAAEVDCAVDCVGFEARGQDGKEQAAVVLNSLMGITRASGSVGIPGLYVTADPGRFGERKKEKRKEKEKK